MTAKGGDGRLGLGHYRPIKNGWHDLYNSATRQNAKHKTETSQIQSHSFPAGLPDHSRLFYHRHCSEGWAGQSLPFFQPLESYLRDDVCPLGALSKFE